MKVKIKRITDEKNRVKNLKLIEKYLGLEKVL